MELYIHTLRRFHGVQRNSITLIFYFNFHNPDIFLSTVLCVCVFCHISDRHHECTKQITFLIKKSCFVDAELSKSYSQNPAVGNSSSHDSGQVKG